ncbi:ParA family protein [Janthinobacterium violaceinigrum]
MKILSVFNNKGGVGKTTLTYHLAHSLSELGNKVLIIDADPQCNLKLL